jgi:DNA-binding response OmpR family regulator
VDGKTQTILVVDDEAEIVQILRDYLEAGGFSVRIARDGAAAWGSSMGIRFMPAIHTTGRRTARTG